MNKLALVLKQVGLDESITINENGKEITKEEIAQVVRSVMQKYKPAIIAIDPEAEVGYRGSFARSIRGWDKRDKKNNNDPTLTDLSNCDIDAFIVSDKMKANRTGKVMGEEVAGVAIIQRKINRELIQELNKIGYRLRKRFEFMIFDKKRWLLF